METIETVFGWRSADSNRVLHHDDNGRPIQIGLELITPDVARTYLAANTSNRNLRSMVFSAYADDMKCGVWAFNGDPIRFDGKGALIDGQHRLNGVIESGISVWMLVIRGLSADQQHTIDTGARRSFADVLKLRGETNYVTLATMVRGVHQWQKSPGSFKTHQFTNSQLLNTLARYPWLRDGCNTLNLVNAKAGLPVGATAGPWFAFTQIDASDAEFFFDRLASDQGHLEGEPTYTLRRTALALRDDIKGQRNVQFLAAITVQAWNKFRDGNECKILRWTRGGSSPQPFPEPH